MPDRGLLDLTAVAATPLTIPGGAPWLMASARWAQITFEVAQQAALHSMPCEVSRPVPCYARLFVLEADDSPAGQFRLATLMSGGRYNMMPRNVLVQGVVDGPRKAVADAFGSPFVAGTVALARDGRGVTATVALDGEAVAALVLPELAAVDPAMLRWDAWLGFATIGGTSNLIEYGPRPEIASAFLSKHATLETPPALPSTHLWRRFRNLNTISACYAEGAMTLTAPLQRQPADG